MVGQEPVTLRGERSALRLFRAVAAEYVRPDARPRVADSPAAAAEDRAKKSRGRDRYGD